MTDNQALAGHAGAETPGAAPANGNGDYTPDDVQVLRDAAHIRRRPGVYIGDTGISGLHHLIYELVYNCVDEALAGYCRNIHVMLEVDGSAWVSDDGRGIPVEIHPEEGRPTLEVVLTKVGAGAKFDKGAYKTSAGLHGMGAKAVTALSEWVEAEVRRNGQTYVQEYERGKPTTDVHTRGPATRTGTKIHFKPDPEIFHDLAFEYERLQTRLRELAFLNKGLSIKLSDGRTGKEETFLFAGGLSEFVAYLNRGEQPLHEPIYFDRMVDDVRVEVALQYTTGEDEKVRCYANNAYNPQGGTHLSGLRSALTRTLNAWGQKEGVFRNGVNPVGEDFRDGLTGLISVQVPEPLFESQTKVRLTNPEIEGIVTSVVNEQLGRFLEENPKEAKRILQKVAVAAEAREAAARAKRALRERKSILSGGGLPGKLMDCTDNDRDAAELFLVEGASAGGTAESGRDRSFQAILPLRGKVLNVEKARPEKFLSNEEICNLISAIGVDIGEDGDLEKLRYGKVVILSDADVDGQHIRTLLLTFFYRQMGKLLENGHIYVARPPLYKVVQKKTTRYVGSAEEMQRELMDRGLAGTTLTVLPPEGAASAPAVFKDEELAALVRVLTPLEESLQILERRGINLATFLGRTTERGLPMIRVLAAGREEWFYTDEEVEAFYRANNLVDDETAHGDGQAAEARPAVSSQTLHEVKAINRGLEELRRRGLGARDLLPPVRVAGREPPPRFVLQNGEQKKVLPHLRDLVSEVRRLGEKGMVVTRFKGLGEMDADDLWETTLDPAKRTLLQVRLDDAVEANQMFQTLMGEKVEPRRDFIQTHSLDVKDLDYHGA